MYRIIYKNKDITLESRRCIHLEKNCDHGQDSSLEIGQILSETLLPNNVQPVFYEIIYRNFMLFLYRIILYFIR